MITLHEAGESGWEGHAAVSFVKWNNNVERAFERRVGFPVEFLLGDWPSADFWEDDMSVDETVDTLIDLVQEEHGSNYMVFL